MIPTLWILWQLQVFSPDGKALLTSSVEGFARLFDVETGGCLVTFGVAIFEFLILKQFAPSSKANSFRVIMSMRLCVTNI